MRRLSAQPASSCCRAGHRARSKKIAEAIVRASFGAEVRIASEVQNNAAVRVALTRTSETSFLKIVGLSNIDISVSAVAQLGVPNRKLCTLVLDSKEPQAFQLKSNAYLTGKDCLVQANSKSAQGISTDSGITVDAMLTCSSGGIYGQGRIVGQRLTDCPVIPDPLATRPPPVSTGTCSKTNHRVELNNSAGSRHQLNPGIYCGGLFIGANSFVTFMPGVYIIKDGPFVLDSNADVVGKHVGFLLSGEKSILNFTSNAKVHLDAPRDGAMAGILLFEDRAASLLREHKITSNYASNLTGTIYFSRGRFVVDATTDVAKNSAYTVIIANQLLLTASPRLVLNSNYNMTDVPVPEGIVKGDRVTLVR